MSNCVYTHHPTSSICFTGISLHQLGFERCSALLLRLLLPLPLHTRSAALAQLQTLASSQLMSYLGSGLERVLESERACQVRKLLYRKCKVVAVRLSAASAAGVASDARAECC